MLLHSKIMYNKNILLQLSYPSKYVSYLGFSISNVVLKITQIRRALNF